MALEDEGRVDAAAVKGRFGLTVSLALGLFLAAVLLIAADLSDGRGFLHDVDDGLREYQIRLYLSGAASWFDLSMPQIRTPDLYVSPWSRLIDLPYVVFFYLSSPLLGEERALSAAFAAWPVVMLAIHAVLVAHFVAPDMIRLQWPRLRIVLAGALMAGLMAIATLEFSPGRIDHHNVQILSAMVMMLGLQAFDRRGGVALGLASALSLLVGLECVPLILVAYAGLVVIWLIAPERAGPVLSSAGATLAVSSIVLALAFISPAGIAAVACDSFSAPYAYLAVGCGLIAALVPLWFGRAVLAGRVAAIGLPSLAMLLLVVALFPSCLAGPYWMIDDLARRYWLEPIAQEHGLFYQLQSGLYAASAIILVLLVVFVFSALAVISDRQRQPGSMVAFAVAGAAMALTLWQMRYIRFAGALVPLFLPLAIAFLSNPENRTHILRGVFAVLAMLAVSGLRVFVSLPADSGYRPEASMGNPCDGGNFSVLQTLPPGRILAPQGLGVPLLLAGGGRHSVNAVPFHRAAPGMSLGFEAFLETDAGKRRRAMEHFTYVAVCRLPDALAVPGDGLYATLSRGQSWPGLVRVDSGSDNPLQIYQIDPKNLR